MKFTTKNNLIIFLLTIMCMIVTTAFLFERNRYIDSHDVILELENTIKENTIIIDQLGQDIAVLEDTVKLQKEIILKRAHTIDSLKKRSTVKISAIKTLNADQSIKLYSQNTGDSTARLSIVQGDTVGIVSIPSIKISNIVFQENQDNYLIIAEYEIMQKDFNKTIVYYDSLISKKDSLISTQSLIIDAERERGEYYNDKMKEQEKEFKKKKRKLVAGMVGSGILSVALIIVSIL